MVIRKGSVTHRDVRQPTTNGPHKKQITAERERERVDGAWWARESANTQTECLWQRCFKGAWMCLYVFVRV